ncbi:MAG TPA: GxxExxY protein [Dehalococcoidia bacterium]|nr:GxxExxY protein [Dehalococcoidia bacterium]
MTESDLAEPEPERVHWELTHQIIGAAYEVHRTLGPGFLERVYVSALMRELTDAGLTAAAEVPIPVTYKGTEIGLYFADILVENTVICEIKAIRAISREHEAQLIHYLKATGTRVGLLINFGAKSAEVKRMML